MMNLAVEGTTRTLGKDQGYLGLRIKDYIGSDGNPGMLSSWEPSPDELARLNAGAPIYLYVLGSSHPPVAIEVGPLPEAEL